MDQWVFVPAAHPDVLTLVTGTNKVGGQTRFSPFVFQPFVPSKHTQIKMFYKIKFCFQYQMDFCLLRIIKLAGSSSSKPSTVKQDTICSKRYFINSIRHKLITFHNRCCLYEMVLYKNSYFYIILQLKIPSLIHFSFQPPQPRRACRGVSVSPVW